MNRHRPFASALLGVLLGSAAAATLKGALPPTDLQTPTESQGRPATPAETLRFLRTLAAVHPELDYRELPIGGGPDSAPIPLVIWPPPGAGAAPELTVLLMAGQHGDEPSGSDALLDLIRDLARGPRPDWRGRLRLIILPEMNPWGIAEEIRNNGSNLDLNRDHLRLQAPETRALHRLFAEWAPEVTIDLHEKPETCNHVEWARATHPSVDDRLQKAMRRIVERAAQALARRDIPSHPFFTRSFRIEPGSSPMRMSVFYHPGLPDPSDSLNSFALQGACAFFVEGAAGPPEGPYGGVVAIQYEAVTALIDAALERAGDLREAVERFRASPPGPRVALQMRQAPSLMEPAGEYTRCGGIADRRTGIRPWMPRVEVTLRRSRPAAYWLPARFAEAAQVLADHGVPLFAAVCDLDAEGEPGRIVGASSTAPEYATLRMAKAAFTRRSVRIHAGDWVVPVSSPYWDLLPVLLEPESQFGLGRYAGLGLFPLKGEDYPVVRLLSLPPPEGLVPWRPAGREEEPAGSKGRRPEEER